MRHGQPAAGVDELRDAPAVEIAESQVAHLAGTDEIAEGADGFLQRCFKIVAVQVVDVDVVGSQPLQARFQFERHPLAAAAARIRVGRDGRVLHLGREHPALAVLRDELADHALGAALGVAVGGIDEIDAGTERRIDDAPRDRFVRLLAKHHGAETDH